MITCIIITRQHTLQQLTAAPVSQVSRGRVKHRDFTAPEGLQLQTGSGERFGFDFILLCHYIAKHVAAT